MENQDLLDAVHARIRETGELTPAHADMLFRLGYDIGLAEGRDRCESTHARVLNQWVMLAALVVCGILVPLVLHLALR